MTLILRFHPAAAVELDAAIARYEEGGIDRGPVFETAFTRTVERCLSWPHSGPVYALDGLDASVRTSGIARTPFRIVYFVDDWTLWVVAVAHERRRPGYWLARLSDAEGHDQ